MILCPLGMTLTTKTFAELGNETLLLCIDKETNDAEIALNTFIFVLFLPGLLYAVLALLTYIVVFYGVLPCCFYYENALNNKKNDRTHYE